MNPLIEISPEYAAELKKKQKKQILRLISGRTDPVLHCEAIVLEDFDNGALIVSTLPCLRSLDSRFLVRREGLPNLYEVSYEEQATLRLIGAGQDFGYKAILRFGDATSIPVPETI